MAYQVISASTTYPNTPETDLLPRVMHTVSYTDGQQVKEMQVNATDPLDALDIVRRLLRSREV